MKARRSDSLGVANARDAKGYADRLRRALEAPAAPPLGIPVQATAKEQSPGVGSLVRALDGGTVALPAASAANVGKIVTVQIASGSAMVNAAAGDTIGDTAKSYAVHGPDNTVLFTVSAPNRWSALGDAFVVSVTDHGAVSNATYVAAEASRNEERIQAAFDSGAKAVHFPAGTYWTRGPWQIGADVHAFGDGQSATVVRVHTDDTGNFISAPSSWDPVTCKASVFNFVCDSFPTLPDLAVDIAEGSNLIVFQSAHGLVPGDVIICDLPYQGAHIAVSTGSLAVGDVVTGGTSGTVGTVVKVEYGSANAYISYDPTTGTLFTAGETVTWDGGASSGTMKTCGGNFNYNGSVMFDGEMFEVASTPTTTSVEVYGSPGGTYDRDYAVMYKIEGGNRGSIGDMTIIGPQHTPEPFDHGTDTPNTDTHPYAVTVIGGIGFRHYDLEIKDFFQAACEPWLCYATSYTNCRMVCQTEYGVNTGQQYAIAISNSQETRISDCYLASARHALTTGGYGIEAGRPTPKCMYTSAVNNVLASNGEQPAVLEHGNSSDAQFISNVIIGGAGIVGSRTILANNYIRASTALGSAIFFQSPSTMDHAIIGNYLFGVACEGGQGGGLISLSSGTTQGSSRAGTTVISRNFLDLRNNRDLPLAEIGSDPGTGTTFTLTKASQDFRFSALQAVKAVDPATGTDRAGGSYQVTSVSAGVITVGAAINAAVEAGDLLVNSGYWDTGIPGRADWQSYAFRISDTGNVEGQDAWKVEFTGNTVHLDDSGALMRLGDTNLGAVHTLDLSDNRIYGGAGPQIYADSAIDRLIMRNNIHHANAQGTSFSGPSWWCQWAEVLIAENNTLISPAHGGFYFTAGPSSESPIIIGNKVYNWGAGGVYGSPSATTDSAFACEQSGSDASAGSKWIFRDNLAMSWNAITNSAHSAFYFNYMTLVRSGNAAVFTTTPSTWTAYLTETNVIAGAYGWSD